MTICNRCSLHCGPHSFPTRRSSDLMGARSRVSRATLGSTSWRGRPTARRSRSCPTSTRSEEHTSELQSHHDLVCRLLLEKKKKFAIISVIEIAAGVFITFVDDTLVP